MSEKNWAELLQHPAGGEHFVQVYQDPAFLCQAVAEYIGTGLRHGEGAILIARPAHIAAFKQQLYRAGVSPESALRRGQLQVLDADATLERFTPGGMPDWQTFHA